MATLTTIPQGVIGAYQQGYENSNATQQAQQQAYANQQLSQSGNIQQATSSGIDPAWATINAMWGNTVLQGYGLTASGSLYSSYKRRVALTANRAFALVKRCLRHVSPESVLAKKNAAASLAVSAKGNGQQALYEEMLKQIVSEYISEELAKAGFTTYLNRSAVERFSGRTEGGIHLTEITNFGRPVPAEVAVKIKGARDSKLFSGFTVLHAGAAMIKTTAQKIREKDPICFGLVEKQPDRLYFIADWIDELCHLTLSELLVDPVFTGSLEQVSINESEIQAEVAERDRLLKTTSVKTWKDNEKQAKSLESKQSESLKPFWKIW